MDCGEICYLPFLLRSQGNNKTKNLIGARVGEWSNGSVKLSILAVFVGLIPAINNPFILLNLEQNKAELVRA